jgi:CelD/BcsL family acetyltransferase involved in cellulose biosynthesis
MDCRDDLGVQLSSPHPIATKQSVCLQLDLPPTFEEYVQGLSKSLRYDVRKSLRDPTLNIRFATEETVARDLDTFFTLHQQRWTKRGLPGAFFAKTKRFHHTFAPAAVKQGLVWLTLLDHIPEGKTTRTIGAVYALSHGKTVHFYQSGFDPEAKALSPGTALVAAIIRRAIEEGKTTFDFLRGDEPYKRRWKPQRIVHGERWVLHDRSPRGLLAYQSVKIASSVEQRLKDRFEGKGLH